MEPDDRYPQWPFPDPAMQSRADRRRQRGRRRRFGAYAIVAAIIAISGAVAVTSDPETSATPTAQETAQQDAGTSLAADQIAEQMDPAIADITAELPNGTAAGTGMVLTSSGDILTNNHVIDGATDISVTIGESSRSYDAELIGTAPEADVALLRIDGVSDLPTVTLGDSSSLEIGDTVVAIGNALDLPGPPRVTEGMITGLDRSISISGEDGSADHLSGLIEINAELQPGNSGGPLFDETGRVIGVNTAAEVAGHEPGVTDASAIGFAIPIDTVEDIVNRIQDGEEGDGVRVGPAGYLGVAIRDGADGAEVQDVEPDSPAATAGIGAGDVIVEVDGTRVSGAAELGDAVRAHEPGDRVRITWIGADGGRNEATVTLAESPVA
jgi:S1-C subfamily serine protease